MVSLGESSGLQSLLRSASRKLLLLVPPNDDLILYFVRLTMIITLINHIIHETELASSVGMHGGVFSGVAVIRGGLRSWRQALGHLSSRKGFSAAKSPVDETIV